MGTDVLLVGQAGRKWETLGGVLLAPPLPGPTAEIPGSSLSWLSGSIEPREGRLLWLSGAGGGGWARACSPAGHA